MDDAVDLAAMGVEAWDREATPEEIAKMAELLDDALAAGALGGKLLGAGGGGFFLFFVQPQHRQAVTAKVRELGCRTTDFRFESNGVTSWRTKIQ